jgi:hypothetical protein
MKRQIRKIQPLVTGELRRKKRQIMDSQEPRAQCATCPQSPSSGPSRCCDVTDLCQAFSQRAGPGRLWTSLDAPRLVTLNPLKQAEFQLTNR